MPNAPTTTAIDKTYFKAPTESVDQYNTRISAYNDSKTKVDAQNAATTAAANPPQTTLAQDQAKTANQGKPGYDALGNPISTPTSTGSGTQTPSGATGASSSTYSPTDTSQEATNADPAVLAAQQKVADTNAFNQHQADIQNGVIPLSSGENAQIDGLKQQFQQMIDAQTLTNTGAVGTANIRGYQTGAAEYDPTFQTKTVNAISAAGAQKIVALQIEMASAVAKLTQSFKDSDIAASKAAFDELQSAQDSVTKAIQDHVDKVQAAIKDAQTQATAAQAEADKQQQYQLDVAKFNQTGDQQSFDNAFKVEQEKIAEKNAAVTQGQAAANAAETSRHNKATEAVAAFNAGMGAGGGGNNVGVSQSAQLGSDGSPDPASQKQVLDQITAKYGPMTAIAIKGLSDYTMNPSDWSSRVAKGGMSREQAVTLAKMYDPTYSDTNYAIRAGYLKNLASSQTGTVGSAVNAANKAINHLTAYVTEMGKIPNTPSTMVNAIDNATLGNIFSPVRQAKAAASTEGLGVAEELAKFFKGSGTVDVASIDAWKSQLSTNASPADIKGHTQGAITLLAGQLETLAEQYQSTMGKAPTTDFLNQSARASLSNLKNQGYEVNIPGINYTDVNAYLKNGGSTDALIKAHQTLVDANDPNNPPNAENALELAQLQ